MSSVVRRQPKLQTWLGGFDVEPTGVFELDSTIGWSFPLLNVLWPTGFKLWCASKCFSTLFLGSPCQRCSCHAGHWTCLSGINLPQKSTKIKIQPSMDSGPQKKCHPWNIIQSSNRLLSSQAFWTVKGHDSPHTDTGPFRESSLTTGKSNKGFNFMQVGGRC